MALKWVVSQGADNRAVVFYVYFVLVAVPVVCPNSLQTLVGGIPAVTKSANPEHLSADLDLWSWDFTPEEKQALDALTSPKGSPSFACASDSAEILV